MKTKIALRKPTFTVSVTKIIHNRMFILSLSDNAFMCTEFLRSNMTKKNNMYGFATDSAARALDKFAHNKEHTMKLFKKEVKDFTIKSLK